MNTKDGYYWLAEFLKQTKCINAKTGIELWRTATNVEWHTTGRHQVKRASPLYTLKLYWGQPHTKESWDKLSYKEKHAKCREDIQFITNYANRSLFNLSNRSKQRGCWKYHNFERYTKLRLTKTEHTKLVKYGL